MSSLCLSGRSSLLWGYETAEEVAVNLRMVTVSCRTAKYPVITIRVQAVM